MGGIASSNFQYFKYLLIRAFEIFKIHCDKIWAVVELLKDYELPCFVGFDMKEFKNRFRRLVSDRERQEVVEQMVIDSLNSRKTYLYDGFQKFS